VTERLVPLVLITTLTSQESLATVGVALLATSALSPLLINSLRFKSAPPESGAMELLEMSQLTLLQLAHQNITAPRVLLLQSLVITVLTVPPLTWSCLRVNVRLVTPAYKLFGAPMRAA